jgi:hypothetical protein
VSDSRSLSDYILAVVTGDAQSAAGGAPIFVVPDSGERLRVAMLIAKILTAMVHDLENGTYLVVRH